MFRTTWVGRSTFSTVKFQVKIRSNNMLDENVPELRCGESAKCTAGFEVLV